jgi:hypothetical protein
LPNISSRSPLTPAVPLTFMPLLGAQNGEGVDYVVDLPLFKEADPDDADSKWAKTGRNLQFQIMKKDKVPNPLGQMTRTQLQVGARRGSGSTHGQQDLRICPRCHRRRKSTGRASRRTRSSSHGCRCAPLPEHAAPGPA